MLFKRLSFMGLLAASFAFAQEPVAAPAAEPAVEQPAASDVPAAPQFKEAAPLQSAPIAKSAEDKSSTISVFVKNPEEIKALQDDLKNLQTMAGGSNPEVAALLARANKIAEMNDRCASVSVNDLLDTACGHFYEVDLPAFENEYMELTGEVRLGSMRMATTLEERTRQLASCSEALTSIVVSREQLLKLRGDVYLEPINFEGDFDAEYNFKLSYDSSRIEQQHRLANLWIDKCGPIVLRQSGTEFAPMFVATLKMKNDSLNKAGSNVKFMMNKKSLSLRVDLRRPVGGAYYLNGVRLFEKTLDADKSKSHLYFDIKNKKAVLNQPKGAIIQKFNGREVFKKLKKMEMVGRWIWNSEKLPEEVAPTSQDESEVMTAEDSLAYKQGLAELERAQAEERDAAAVAAVDPTQKELDADAKDAKDAIAAAAANDAAGEKKGGIHWIPLSISAAALIGGGVLFYYFNDKAKQEKDHYLEKLDHGSDSGFEDHKKSAGDYQRNRALGLTLGILGAVGVALSFVF